MAQILELRDVTLAYDVVGHGEPLVLAGGCGAPAVAFHLELVPALVGAGYQVVTYDHRGMAPSSSPPAPYHIDELVDDLLGLLDHLGHDQVCIAGHSMGGWVAEMMAARHPQRVRAAAFMGSCNPTTAWERVSTQVQRDLARLDVALPRLFDAVEALHYLPIADLQDDQVVEEWMALLGDAEAWANPGRLGQWEACLTWSTNPERSAHWPSMRVPCLILAFEHDLDSPPARARQAAGAIPGARYLEILGASHLGPITHATRVAQALADFFAAP